MVIGSILEAPVDGYGFVQVNGVRVRAYFEPTRLTEQYLEGTRALISLQRGGAVVLWVLP